MSDTNWQKSSFSGEGNDNHCVELATTDGGGTIALREGDAPGVVVTTTPASLAALLLRVKRGEGLSRTRK